MKYLQIENVSKSFGKLKALDDVSIGIDKGKMLVVLGASGCGKTTLLRCIAGFETPDSGAISIAGQPMFGAAVNLKPEQRRIGYVPQDGVLFPHLSVAHNIAFGLARGSAQERRVDEMLELVGMSGLGARMPHQLSGGQQQRVALARALAPAPALVLMDEPFSALDAGLRETLREDVRLSLELAGATSVLVTHDQEEALSMADMVAVMHKGACAQIDDPVTLYKYPANLQVARFVGDATILQLAVEDGQAISPFGKLQVARGCPFDCKQASIMVRPEQFVLGNTDAQVQAQVQRCIFYGHDAMISLKLDDALGLEQIRVRAIGAPHLQTGQTVGLKVVGEVMAYACN